MSDNKSVDTKVPVPSIMGNIHSSVVALRKTKMGERAWSCGHLEYYSFGRKTCGNNYNHEQELTITILLGKINVNGPRTMLRLPQRKNPIPQGGGVLIKSSSFLYGRDTDDQNGLIVILRARRRDDDKELPIMITVKHYFCCRVLLSWCLCCGKDS